MKLLLLCLSVTAASAGLAPLITSNQRSVPDRWIVKIKEGVDVDEVADEILGRFSKMRFPTPKVGKLRKVLPALTLNIPARLIDDIRSIDAIEYIEQDSLQTLATTQAFPPWGLDRIDGRSGINLFYTYNPNVQGQGVNIYILDTGVQTTHKAFGGRAYLLYGEADDQGHGTHCAGTAAGNTYGIARQANIYSAKVCIKDAGCPHSDILNALDAVLNHAGGKGGVISMSLSGVSYTSSSQNNAMKNMWNNGFVLSHAAGNDNADACSYSPQMIDEVISTGAINMLDRRASFSNYGKCVDLFAPGDLIRSAKYSTWSDSLFTLMSGTSMACPHTTGAIALLMGKDPTKTPQEIKDALLSDTTPDEISDVKGSPNKLLYVRHDD